MRLNTRIVSQLDGLPARYAGNLMNDPPGMVRIFVQGFHGSMLFWPDEVEGA